MTKKLKIAILLFALTFIVGAAFAATNGVLVFGGTVRINSTTTVPDNMRLEFIYAQRASESHWILDPDIIQLEYELIQGEDGRKFLSFDLTVLDSAALLANRPYTALGAAIRFRIQNTGNVPVRLTGFHWGSTRPVPGIGVSMPGTNSFNVPSRLGYTFQPGQVSNGDISFSYSFLDLFNSPYEYTFNYRIELRYVRAD